MKFNEVCSDIECVGWKFQGIQYTVHSDNDRGQEGKHIEGQSSQRQICKLREDLIPGFPHQVAQDWRAHNTNLAFVPVCRRHEFIEKTISCLGPVCPWTQQELGHKDFTIEFISVQQVCFITYYVQGKRCNNKQANFQPSRLLTLISFLFIPKKRKSGIRHIGGMHPLY